MELIDSVIYHYPLKPLSTEMFETGLSTSPPFSLKQIHNSVTVQIVVFVFSVGFSTVQYSHVLLSK